MGGEVLHGADMQEQLPQPSGEPLQEGIPAMVGTGFHRQCRVRVAASDDVILSSSLSTMGALHPYHLLRGGGVTVELEDAPSPPAGPTVVGEGSCGTGIAVVEEDWEVLSRWFSLIAQALPRAKCNAGPGTASAEDHDCSRRGDQAGHPSAPYPTDDGAHFSSPVCARFFGRLIAMSVLWDECDGSALAPSCWDGLWVGLNEYARHDAAQVETRMRGHASTDSTSRHAPHPCAGCSAGNTGLIVDAAECTAVAGRAPHSEGIVLQARVAANALLTRHARLLRHRCTIALRSGPM